MKIKKTHGQRSRFELRFLTFALLISLNGFASVSEAIYSLPANRSIQWQGNVGVLNDIPTRSTIYTTLSPSGSSDTSAIQTAINNCPTGQVVKLNAGTFKITGPITVKAGITVRGSGMGNTILKGQAGLSNFIIGINGSSSYGTSQNLVISGSVKGKSSITTTTDHGWKAGDLVLIDQLNSVNADPPVDSTYGNDGQCKWCGRGGLRSLGQTVRITGVPTSTTATIEIPLYWNYNSTLTPQGSKCNSTVVSAGIENLTVDNSLSGSSAQTSNGTVLLQNAANCWLFNLEVIGGYRQTVTVFGGYRNTIRNCKFHEGVPATDAYAYDTSRAYGIYLMYGASANLIENNEFYHLTMSIVLSGPVSGNVISYNYFHSAYNYLSNWQQNAIDCHGAHPMMNLYEGNYISGMNIQGDYVWGSSSHNTLFRNRISNTTLSCGPWAIDLYAKARYYNVVGNVIGAPTDNSYELNNSSFNYCSGNTSARSIFKLGYINGGDSNATGNDEMVRQTLLRHSNFDYVHNSTILNDNLDSSLNSSDGVLPSSLYLSSKPSWWGNVAWPYIGPDVSPMFPPIPTDGGTPLGTSKPLLSAPTSLRVQ
jgi:hypothetical protein